MSVLADYLLMVLALLAFFHAHVAHKRIETLHRRISLNSRANGLYDNWDELAAKITYRDVIRSWFSRPLPPPPEPQGEGK